MVDFRLMLMSQIATVDTELEIRRVAEGLRNSSLFEELSSYEYDNSLQVAIETLQISYGESYSVESDEKHTPWFSDYYKDLGATRWDRYRDYLQTQKNFAPSVISGMQESLFKIMDLVGNPSGDNFKRKGLVVGDVQSGKTANYVGLMNLAADANYKLMIVLTGTTNTLREQTQIRIEEGLGKARLAKGVGIINNSMYQEFSEKHPSYLTTREDDFKATSRRNIQQSIEATSVPIVIVTKKNSTALKNIHEWLKQYSLIQNHDHIDSSLLLIDDEADFASVNVNNENDKPTAINSKIRDILELFTKSSYIGFTATPFANIFIDPESNEEMYGQDLFPRDYIYVLGESDKYIGVQSVFGEEAKHKDMVVELEISEVETYLGLKHKKEDVFNKLSPSMIDAINVFLLANVIRDLRGQKNAHRSMLFNISRFISMHEQIRLVVLQYLDKVKLEVRLFGKLPLAEALQKETISELRNSFEKHYSNLEANYNFEFILKNMIDSIHNIEVEVVNSKNNNLNYLGNEEQGLRVIIIGGFSLSRGLTLEGLMTSYYFRNSVMYDSLLQMGRWFGYRPKYGDLCRIFMTQATKSDFEFIALATQELKEDLEANSKRGLTPRDFGIRVRTGQNGLIITARNKMRTGEKFTAKVNYSKDIIETTAMTLNDVDLNQRNNELIKQLVDFNHDKISNELDPRSQKTLGLIGLDKLQIISFLQEYSTVISAKFDSELIIKWLRSNNSLILDKWDVAFITGSNDEKKFDYGYGITGKTSYRKVHKSTNYEGIYLNSKSRLGSPSDGRLGLTKKQYQLVKTKFKKSDKISQKSYFDVEINHKPIIYIYSVVPNDHNKKELVEDNIPLISIGIPDLGYGKSKYVNYVVNRIFAGRNDEGIEVEDE